LFAIPARLDLDPSMGGSDALSSAANQDDVATTRVITFPPPAVAACRRLLSQ
jgi:hypothetical protein